MSASKEIKEMNFLGFHNISEFFVSLFGIKFFKVNAVVALFAGLTTFISNWVWVDPQALYFLWFLMFCDFFTGVVKSMINKTFVSYKLFRMILFFISTALLIALSMNLAKHSDLFFLLPSIVMGGFYSVYFVSLCENLGELGWLPKPIITMIKKRFGLKALQDKYFDDESNKEIESDNKN